MSLNKLKTRQKAMIRRIVMQVNSFVASNDLKLAQSALKVFTMKQGVQSYELLNYFRNFEELSDLDLYFEGNSHLYRLVQETAQSLSNFVYDNAGRLPS